MVPGGSSRALLAVLCLVGASCAHQEAPLEPDEPVNQYSMTGTIVRLETEYQSALIDHEEIPGWMEAMTMEFPVKDRREFDKLKPGMRIKATVYQKQSGVEYWIAGIEALP